MAQAVTSLEQLRGNADAVRSGDNASAVGLVDGESFNLAQRIAGMLAKSTLVPKAYQGNLPNCVIALNMAARIGADPLMVMQNLYVVHGNPSWSSQFLIASFNKCGRFSALRYQFVGKEATDDWGCKAWAIEKETGERLEGALVTIALAKKEGWYGKNGSKWQSMPQQMLMYRAASWFVRAFAPEIAMGLHTAEEVHDTYDMGRADNGTFTMTSTDIEVEAEQKAEAILSQAEAEEPQEPSPDTAQAQAEPESKEIECDIRGTVVRTGVECAKCADRDGKCPYWNS